MQLVKLVHFDVTKERPDRGWVIGTNGEFTNDIAVTWAKHVDDSFHARFSAKAHRYRYIIQNTINRPGILCKGVSIYQGNFDVELMQDAANYIIGEHDFSSFRQLESGISHLNALCTLCKSNSFGQYIVFDIAANAFLMHMVRNII